MLLPGWGIFAERVVLPWVLMLGGVSRVSGADEDSFLGTGGMVMVVSERGPEDDEQQPQDGDDSGQDDSGEGDGDGDSPAE